MTWVRTSAAAPAGYPTFSGALVTLSTNQTIATSGKIQFDTTIYDTDSYYSAANDWFVAPADGFYIVSFHAQMINVTATTVAWIDPVITSALAQPANVRFGRDQGDSTLPSREGTLHLKLESGDTVYVNANGDASFDVRSAGTFMAIARIG